MASAETNPAPVVELRGATFAVEAPHWVTLREVRLVIAAGELMAVQASDWSAGQALAAAILGLANVSAGEICYSGQRWTGRQPRRECRLRGEIGRVFAGPAWISNLSVLENVVLAARHHTVRPDAELEREADDLARRFGLPQVPRGRPAHLSDDISQRAQWTRALLGAPKLLVLEQPVAYLADDARTAAYESLAEARRRGAAVVWLSDRRDDVTDPRLRATDRWELVGQELRPLGGASP